MSDRDILKAAMESTPECLTAEQLESLLDGKHSHPHLAQCARCQAELAMLKSFEAGAPLPDEGAAVAWISAHLDRELEAIKNPARGRLSRPASQSSEPRESWLARAFGLGGMRWILPVAGLTAVAIAGAIMLRPEKAPDLQANAGGQAAIYRSLEIQAVSPVGDLQQVPRELQWHAVPGATAYKVVVMEIDHSVLWTSETKETLAGIPPLVGSKLLPGKPILWQVTALDAQGRVLGSSQVEKFISLSNSSQ